MAEGNELILGFVGPRAIEKAAKSLGLRVDFEMDEEQEGIGPTAEVEKFNQDLAGAHHGVLVDGMDFKRLPSKKKDQAWHRRYETPLGEREFAVFRLELHFDPGEMNEDPEDAVLGVAITGRYVPTCADWRDPNGAPWVFAFDKELTRVMDFCKKRITDTMRCFEDAIWTVKMKHY